jgi:short-subunit dehydrogenase
LKTVLITGASRGIGLEHVRAYAQRGVNVLAAVRFPGAAIELQQLASQYSGMITLLEYDALNPDAAPNLRFAVGDTPIDLLLANAGVMGKKSQNFGSIEIEEMVRVMRVNCFAPLKLAEVFAGNVARSGRKLIAFQSSLMGSIAENSSGGSYAYRTSKAALNMVAKGAANDLRAIDVTVVALHPGWVQTRMGGEGAQVTAERCVSAQQKLFDRLKLTDSGRFFNSEGKDLSW